MEGSVLTAVRGRQSVEQMLHVVLVGNAAANWVELLVADVVIKSLQKQEAIEVSHVEIGLARWMDGRGCPLE